MGAWGRRLGTGKCTVSQVLMLRLKACSSSGSVSSSSGTHGSNALEPWDMAPRTTFEILRPDFPRLGGLYINMYSTVGRNGGS